MTRTQVWTREECWNCRGDGKVYGKDAHSLVDCEHCKGTGWIESWQELNDLLSAVGLLHLAE